MGYETRLYIGETYAMTDGEDVNYLSQIAMINLCKSDFYDTWIDESDKEDSNKVYFYPDGNTKTTQDCYGSILYAIDPAKVLKFMVKHNKGKDYRRYNAAIPLLRNLIKDFNDERLKCILFGH